LAYISAAKSIRVSSTTFTQSAQKATEFDEITKPLGLLRRSKSFKVIEFGTNRKLVCDCDMNLGPKSIQWCDSFKYLGVTFQAGPKLYINIDVIKQKFFTASNSVLGNSHSLDEIIQLQLLESFCCLFYNSNVCR